MSAPLSRLTMRFLGRLLLAAMLFAQLATAAQACVKPQHAAQMVRTVAHAHPCHGMDMAMDEAPAANATAGMSANLCAAQAGDQSADIPQVTIHAMPALPVLQVALMPELPPAARQPGEESRRTTGDPPIPILFQVFRS